MVGEVGVEREPEAVEDHRQPGVRPDDEDELDELSLVELLGQPGPGVVGDPVAVDELVDRGEHVGVERATSRRRRRRARRRRSRRA